MTNNKPQKGFTLIELLVVVAIISLLSSVVLGALNDARAKARDRALVQQVKQIQNALELYRGKYGEYPDGTHGDLTLTSYNSELSSSGTWLITTSGNHLSDRLSEFLPTITPPARGSIRYYNRGTSANRYSWCTDKAGAIPAPGLAGTNPPYTIWITLETDYKNNFPNPVYADGTGIRTSQSCFSL